MAPWTSQCTGSQHTPTDTCTSSTTTQCMSKRGLVKCLYNRARSITLQKDDLVKETDHLLGALKLNDYPQSFIRSVSSPRHRAHTT